ncbi:HalD/BesD family halogenase [Planktotalea arctica]|uniref:HalD/BesD family halogenase n=1 Tax=Planktotalea arctica TaxID=1481893 RepID=UPI000A16E298|nr:2OG-Fe(II) oxygenase [Planktotalea arctica]
MHDILDLETYPLDQPDSVAFKALLARCKVDLAAHGMFNLVGFMKPAPIAETLAYALPKFETEAFRHERMHNVYFKKIIPDVPDDSPLYTQFQTSNLTLCGDQVAPTAVTQLYEWQPFVDFLAAVMDRAALYPMDDALARLNVMAYGDGQGLNWHFDRSEFTTTLLLQAPEAGSTFLYRTDLRTADDPNHEGVAKLVRGEDTQVQALDVTPGTLNVFRGVNTPHCVTPAKGPRPRVVTVLTYYETPGAQFSDEERLGFYGRTS